MTTINENEIYPAQLNSGHASCATCVQFSALRGICLKSGEKRAGINLTCPAFVLRPEGFVEEEPAPTPPETRVCDTCGRELPVTAFSFMRGGRRRTSCRECIGQMMRDAKAAKASRSTKPKAAKKPRLGKKAKAYEAPAVEELPSTVGAVLPDPVPAVTPPAVEPLEDIAQDAIPEGWPVQPFRGGRPVSEWSTAELIEELRSRGFTGHVERREEYAI